MATTTTITKKTHNKKYSFEEVKQHNTKDDAWIVIDNSVYDVTKFAKFHPGGSVILSRAGNDATDAFHAFHSKHGGDAYRKLASYKIGELDEPLKVEPHIRDFREIREKMEQQGLFTVNLIYPLIYMLIWMTIYAVGVAVLFMLPHSWFATILSGCIVGISWGQAGFTMHDFGHNSIFKSPEANHYANLFVFNFLLGGSDTWWRGRHNRHHAAANHVDIDLDIRTLPLFAWDELQVAKYIKRFKNLKFQYLYWIFCGPNILFILYRILNTLWLMKKASRLERIASLGHWVLKFGFLIPNLGWNIPHYFVWEFFALLFSGGYLGWIFSLNHYMHPLIRGPVMDWVLGTTTTTQNITPSLFIDWFTGHLDYQIEHHLFPCMPRFNLPIAHEIMKPYFKKHNIKTYEESFGTAVSQVFKVLYKAGHGGAKLAEAGFH